MAELGVLVVHGMGAQRPGCTHGFATAVDGVLARAGVPKGTVLWEEGYWADVLNGAEDDLWLRMAAGGELEWTRLRRFFLTAFADAVAYQRSVPGTGSPDATYARIHARLRERLERLRDALGADRPLVVVAHSLGTVIASNYAWDEQHRPTSGASPFARLETLAGLITLGSNLPLFTLALPQVECIAFPAPGLPRALREAARWINCYDPDDVLAWPLRPLGGGYETRVAEDRIVNVGDWRTSWNPASHERYWDDEDVLAPTAELLRQLVLAGREAEGQAMVASALASALSGGSASAPDVMSGAALPLAGTVPSTVTERPVAG